VAQSKVFGLRCGNADWETDVVPKSLEKPAGCFKVCGKAHCQCANQALELTRGDFASLRFSGEGSIMVHRLSVMSPAQLSANVMSNKERK